MCHLILRTVDRRATWGPREALMPAGPGTLAPSVHGGRGSKKVQASRRVLASSQWSAPLVAGLVGTPTAPHHVATRQSGAVHAATFGHPQAGPACRSVGIRAGADLLRRGHPRGPEPRHPHADPEQPRRWLRPDRPGGGGHDGGPRHHRRHLRRHQHDRCGWVGRDDRADEREGRRARDDDRRPRRGRLALLLRQRLQAPGRHPAGPADRGVRRRPRPGGLAVQDHRRPRRRHGRPTPARSWSAAGPRPVARTTSSRCSWPAPSASTRRRSATSPTTAVAR